MQRYQQNRVEITPLQKGNLNINNENAINKVIDQNQKLLTILEQNQEREKNLLDKIKFQSDEINQLKFTQITQNRQKSNEFNTVFHQQWSFSKANQKDTVLGLIDKMDKKRTPGSSHHNSVRNLKESSSQDFFKQLKDRKFENSSQGILGRKNSQVVILKKNNQKNSEGVVALRLDFCLGIPKNFVQMQLNYGVTTFYNDVKFETKMTKIYKTQLADIRTLRVDFGEIDYLRPDKNNESSVLFIGLKIWRKMAPYIELPQIQSEKYGWTVHKLYKDGQLQEGKFNLPIYSYSYSPSDVLSGRKEFPQFLDKIRIYLRTSKVDSKLNTDSLLGCVPEFYQLQNIHSIQNQTQQEILPSEDFQVNEIKEDNQIRVDQQTILFENNSQKDLSRQKISSEQKPVKIITRSLSKQTLDSSSKRTARSAQTWDMGSQNGQQSFVKNKNLSYKPTWNYNIMKGNSQEESVNLSIDRVENDISIGSQSQIYPRFNIKYPGKYVPAIQGVLTKNNSIYFGNSRQFEWGPDYFEQQETKKALKTDRLPQLLRKNSEQDSATDELEQQAKKFMGFYRENPIKTRENWQALELEILSVSEWIMVGVNFKIQAIIRIGKDNYGMKLYRNERVLYHGKKNLKVNDVIRIKIDLEDLKNRSRPNLSDTGLEIKFVAIYPDDIKDIGVIFHSMFTDIAQLIDGKFRLPLFNEDQDQIANVQYRINFSQLNEKLNQK